MTTKILSIPQAEITELNDIILELLGKESFVLEVESELEAETFNSPETFVSHDTVQITESDIDHVIEKMFRVKCDKPVPTAVYEYVHENLNGGRIREMEDVIRQILKDEDEYQRNPLGYIGMSQSDFI